MPFATSQQTQPSPQSRPQYGQQSRPQQRQQMPQYGQRQAQQTQTRQQSEPQPMPRGGEQQQPPQRQQQPQRPQQRQQQGNSRLVSDFYSKISQPNEQGTMSTQVEGRDNNPPPQYSEAPEMSNRLGQGTPVGDQQFGPPAHDPVPNNTPAGYTGNDPYLAMQNDRGRAIAYGDQMNQQLQNFGNDEDYWRQYYRGQGNSAYGEIAAGRGGYRPEETNDIIGRQGLQDLQMTPDERNNLFLNDSEQAANYGNPNAAMDWFDPAWVDQTNTEGNQRINESVNQGAAGQRNAYGQGASALRGSYDPNDLRMRGDYGADVSGALSGTEGAVRGNLNRNNLTLDPSFRDRYGMTDRDVNDMTQSAALTQGALTRGRVGAVNRAAAASGGSNPLALAAGLNNLAQTGDQQSQDAMLRARIAARGEQADREKNIEQMRLGAEGNYANMANNAELQLGGRRYGALQDTENMRLNAAGGVADRALNVENTLGARNLGVEQSIADRGYNSANQLYQNNTGNARYIGETGAGIATGADAAGVARSQYNSANRQNTEQYAQGQRYGRGMDQNNAISQRTVANAAPRLSNEQEYRNYLTGQQTQANDNVNNTFANQIRNYGQSGQLAQGSTGQLSQYDLGRRGQSFGTNFKTSLGQAAGKFIGSPKFGG